MREKLRNICLVTFVISVVLGIITISYGYFKPVVDNIEDKSTIKLDGAEIYANYSSTSTINVEDIEPSDDVIGYKDFSLEVKNTSSRDVSAYIYLDIIYSDYTDIENDGVLYYELVSEDNVVVDKTMIKAISSGKALLYELVIPSNTGSTTINYRLNIYFPLSDKIQNLNKGEDGTMKFNSKIEVMNESLSLKNYISKLNMEENGLEYDDFGNLRYVGSSPNNYITFNDETWRIIGIVDGYVKIIREDRITDDEGNYEFEWNSEYINDWSKASLKDYLNEEYYNSLTPTAQKQIETTTWDIGGIANDSSGYEIKETYSQERGETTYNNSRPTDWTGNIALMYPSDFGYASTNTSCRSNLSSGDCSYSNWLYSSRVEFTYNEWLLSTMVSSSIIVLYIGSYGIVGTHFIDTDFYVRPTLHLTNETTRVSGTGTSLDPYIIQ